MGALERIHGRKHNFYPRPPRGGRRPVHGRHHTLMLYFYPRPPRGGRRIQFFVPLRLYAISIHALREEGDFGKLAANPWICISIHALREEGDL